MDTTSILNTTSPELDCKVHPTEPICVADKVLIGLRFLFALIGLVSNSLLIKKYLTRKNLNILFHCLIVSVAIWDIFFLINTAVSAAGTFVYPLHKDNLPFYLTMAILTTFTFSGSIFTKMVLAIDRYLVLCQVV